MSRPDTVNGADAGRTPHQPATPPAGLAHHVAGPRLVGRHDQLAALDAQIASVLDGSFRVMLISGAPGVGKTRLATELVARHADRATCCWARAHRWGTASSFGLWVEALDRHLRDRHPDEIRALCGTSIDDMAALLKPVEEVTGPRRGEPQRARLLEGFVDLFDRLSARDPVLVALDDVHLADDSSWEALRYLGSRLPASPIGVIATARPGALREHVAASDVLVGLDDDGLLQRETLPPLERGEIAELAHAVLQGESGRSSTLVPEPLVAWLAERSLGHPLFVVSLIRALVRERSDLADPHLEALPATLRERVQLDLRHLGGDERELLEILAVVAQRTDPRGLVRLSGWSLDRIDAALQPLLATWLVVEQGRDTDLVYEIAHPMIQDTIYEDIGSARRRSLHRTVARVLAGSDQLGAAAAHFARSADRGDTEAVEALCRAMRQAEERGLYQEALRTMVALLELLPPGDDRWRRVLDSMRWQSEWVLSHLAERDADVAIEVMRRIEALLDERHDPAARATVQFHLAAFLSFGAGHLAEAEQACRHAMRLFEESGELEPLLLTRNELAWIHGCRGDLPAHATLARATMEEALAADCPRAAVQAAGTAAYALGIMGHYDDAERLYGRSIELARATQNQYRVAWGHAQRSVPLGLAGRLDDAAAAAHEALALGPLAGDAIVHEDLAHCAWLRGDLPEVVAQVEQSTIRRPIRGSRRRAWVLALAARAHGEMGHRTRAVATLEQAEATYEGRHIMAWSPWCEWSRGALAAQDGDADGALSALDAAARRFETIGAAGHEALVLVDLAELAGTEGDRKLAARCARRIDAIAERTEGNLAPALASLAGSIAHMLAERLDDAVEAAASAEGMLSSQGYALYATVGVALRGRALRTVDRARAVELLTAATEQFDQLRATWRRDEVVAVLRRLGSRGRRSAAAISGPDALTARERDVVALAARGYTAREIGERLFIGRRTVESHLASSYAKLGVASKRELIRRASQLGLEASRNA